MMNEMDDYPDMKSGGKGTGYKNRVPRPAELNDIGLDFDKGSKMSGMMKSPSNMSG